MAPIWITIFGGSGFLGRYAVRRLAKLGYGLRIAVRRPDEALFLKTSGDIGQIVPMAANIRDEASVGRALEGADLAINLVGVLAESGRQTFAALQADGAARIARRAKAAGISRVIHVSAIGADPASPSAYARAKAAGESRILTLLPRSTILRPSLIIGPEDDFFNRFARMASLSPILPLLGGGRTRFQPVFVGDVAEAIAAVLSRPDSEGRIYELGGPRIYTFRQLLEMMLREIGRRRGFLSLPFPLARLMGALLQYLPFAPLTLDQVRQLARDNVVASGALGFAELGLTPLTIEAVIPDYLAAYRAGARRRLA